MSDSKYIGRGEEISKQIFLKLIDLKAIMAQVGIRFVAQPEDYKILDPEVQQHKFDLVLLSKKGKKIVVEINYHHKEKAAKKWHNIFIPILQKAGYDFVTVNDWDCRQHGLFWLDSKKEHPKITWDDYRDIIDALEIAGITPTVYPFE